MFSFISQPFLISQAAESYYSYKSLSPSFLPSLFQINSSMPALPLLDVPLDAATKLPEHAVIDVGGIQVALLGKEGVREGWKKGGQGGRKDMLSIITATNDHNPSLNHSSLPPSLPPSRPPHGRPIPLPAQLFWVSPHPPPSSHR